ncbi:MAG: ribonuclease D [Gammaproteobacteria bacterium]|nr:ribonuclease D [Gammaproteobacteria bacterium]MBV9697893.1 ribonuclease D [Gammaproteobacteria bacterium]
MQPIITTDAELAALGAELATQPRLALDTEFLRERTYHAQLCLVQLGAAGRAVCVDPLAVTDLGPLGQLLTAPQVLKVMHASRQDLEVLLPLARGVGPIFDTQVAAALAGFPAQVGYADLVRRLLGQDLPKSHTRTDWARRPLSPAQLEYALDDVRYLLPLAAALEERLAQAGRSAWLAEELAALEDPTSLSTEPQDAWRRLRGVRELDPGRVRLAQALAAWRERTAIAHDRPRGWILEEGVLRELVLRVPRSVADLEAIEGLPAGLIRKRGAELLECVAAAQVPDPAPPLPGRTRPDPQRTALLKRLAGVTQQVAGELKVAPELLATRRDLELLADGEQDVAVLRGWRRAVLGETLLAQL